MNYQKTNLCSKLLVGFIFVVPVVLVYPYLVSFKRVKLKTLLISILIISLFSLISHHSYLWYLSTFENISSYNSEKLNIYSFLGSVILTSVVEESINRGISIEFLKLKEKTNNWIIVSFTTIIFALGHLPGWFPFLNTLGLGAILAIVYIRERNLWYPIIMHAIFNFLTFVY